MDINAFFAGLGAIFATGRKDEVSVYLRQSLNSAEDENDLKSAVAILNETAGYYRSISDYAGAFRAIERALSLMSDLGLEDSAAYGTTLLNAATAYRAAGDAATAMEHFDAARAIYERELPENDARLAALYNNLSALHQDAGQHEAARENLEKAAAVLSALPEAALDAATVQANLALTLSALQREDEAASALRRSLDIFERAGRPDARSAPHYAAALAGLAAVHYKMGRFGEAVRLYDDALTRIKDCFGENKDYALTCSNCALACEALGKTEEAEAYRNRSRAALAALGL